MLLRFSQVAGRHERLRRIAQNNPLFPESLRSLTAQQLEEAQRLDHEELSDFVAGFRTLVHEVVQLPPNAESERILEIKSRLDEAYEQSARLADDQSETQTAIRKLVGVIMAAVQRGAGNDTVALSELAQEQAAREAHYALLAFPLVADLLDPQSVVTEALLVPTLLSAEAEALQAACTLFDGDQLAALAAQAGTLIDQTPGAPETAQQALLQLRGALGN